MKENIEIKVEGEKTSFGWIWIVGYPKYIETLR